MRKLILLFAFIAPRIFLAYVVFAILGAIVFFIGSAIYVFPVWGTAILASSTLGYVLGFYKRRVLGLLKRHVHFKPSIGALAIR